MSSAEHIVLLTPGFPANEADDSCIPALHVFLAECAALHPELKFSVIAFQYPFTFERYRWKGIDVYPCNGRNRKWPARMLTWRKAKRIFRQLHREHPVSTIHSFWLGECAQAGEALARANDLPHLVTLMGQDVLPSNHYLGKPLFANTPVVALCERHAQHFEKNAGRKPGAIVPWGVEGEALTDVSRPRMIDLFAAGSLIPLKRYDMLVRLVAALKADFPGLNALIAGDGPERKRLEELSRMLGVEKNIRFAGQLSREEVQLCMRDSRILVHPSEFESYGFVFAEALKQGMRIVSFPVGIASASERWRVADSEKELIVSARQFLSETHNLAGIIPYAAAATAGRYAELYRSLRTYRDRRS